MCGQIASREMTERRLGPRPAPSSRTWRMAKLSTYALAGALAFALAPVAGYAADLPEPPLLEPVAPVEFGSAWYLRGDIGYKNYRNPDVSFKGYAALQGRGPQGHRPSSAAASATRSTTGSAPTSRSITRFKSKFRRHELHLHRRQCGGPNVTATSSPRSTLGSSFWNVYVDLGEWHGVHALHRRRHRRVADLDRTT